MNSREESVLVAGFNTRPLAYSLTRAGYEVYAVDFFGDLDLYPYVKDCLILTKKLKSSYDLIKTDYSEYLPLLILELLEKYPDIKYLVIGSGLDDALEERTHVMNEIKRKKYSIFNLNNNLEAIKKSRNIIYIFKTLMDNGFKVPKTLPFEEVHFIANELEYPFVLKKRSGSGGINIYKIQNKSDLSFRLNFLNSETFDPNNWLMQEYIKGNPVSCTTISNGIESEVISVNNQLVGEKALNSPKEFMYCGNIVPANLTEEVQRLIIDISLFLSTELSLKGINGFDFVVKDEYPYLMEINPRIPGSIRVSEDVMNLNLLDLHVKSFSKEGWDYVRETLKNAKFDGFATKMIYFAPKEIHQALLNDINALEHVHDKSEPVKNLAKSEPVCTVLFKAATSSKSYLGALEVVEKINKLIG